MKKCILNIQKCWLKTSILFELIGKEKMKRIGFNLKLDTTVKIILVDDDPIVILLQKKLMKKVGMLDEVDSFNSGEEALDFLEDERLMLDEYLMFLDINMPGLSGWQVLDTLIESKLDGKISVIIITSSIEQAEREKSKQYDQVIDFWIKPFNLQSFARLKEHKIIQKFFKEA